MTFRFTKTKSEVYKLYTLYFTISIIFFDLLNSSTALGRSDGNSLELLSQSRSSNTSSEPQYSIREPKLGSLFDWLFGPPVNNNATQYNPTTPSSPSLLNHTKPHQHRIKSKTSTEYPKPSLIPASSSIQSPPLETDNSVEVTFYKDPMTNDTVPARRLSPKPRSRTARSSQTNKGENAGRQIQITDIQQVPGAEIPEHTVNGDPSQINLQEELAAIDQLEKNLSANGGLWRRKRQSLSQYGQIQLPYNNGGGYHQSLTNNNGVRELSKRQLFLSPAEQQMMVLRQQQELAAAATLLQQQQFLGSRYSNRYIDDYYDDDSSYEDSDEYDNFRRYGMSNPLRDAMRRGVLFSPGVNHPYGLGRRSLPDQEPIGRGKGQGMGPPPLPYDRVQGSDVIGDTKSKQLGKKTQRSKPGTRGDLGPIYKDGRWDLIEDYDLTSEINRIQSRKGKPNGMNGFMGESHREMDERSEEVEDNMNDDEETQSRGIFRNLGRGRDALERQSANDTVSTTETGSTATSASSTTIDEATGSGSTVSASTPTTTAGTASTSSSSTVDPTQTVTSSSAPSVAASSTIETTAQSSETSETTSTTPAETTSNSSAGSSSTPEAVGETSNSLTSSTSSAGNATSSSTTLTSAPTTSTTIPSTTTKKPTRPPYRQTLNCRCGVQSVRGESNGEGLIIRTMVNPWLVTISTKQKHLCSGSIINNKYIITSKQCVEGLKGLIVTAGRGSRAPTNFTVTNINPHKSLNIALLKIRPAVKPNHAMRPICLPIKSHPGRSNETMFRTPETGILVTFKRASSKSNSPLELVQTEVPFLKSSKCTNSAGDSIPGTICPGPPASMKCGGDTGGLLQAYQSGYSYVQIGVVSTTVGCRANDSPGVYTDLRKSVKWVLNNTHDARYCRKPKVSTQTLLDAIQSSPSHSNEEGQSDETDSESLEDDSQNEEWLQEV